MREGCYLCHSQMIRALRFETQRYGPHSVAASRCTTGRSSGAPSAPARTSRASAASTPTSGSACTCVDPRAFVPASNMPGYPWLAHAQGRRRPTSRRACARCARSAIRTATRDIAAAPKAVAGKTELDALVAYLQGLGVASADAAAPRRRPRNERRSGDTSPASSRWSLMLVFIGHLGLGLAAASQAQVRRAGEAAAGDEPTRRSDGDERLLVGLGRWC